MFPTKILLAADGSEGSRLDTRNATELSPKPGSEPHVVYVAPEYPYYTT